MATPVKDVKTAQSFKKTARKTVTASRARKRTQALQVLAPPAPPQPAHLVPRTMAGLEQILERMQRMSGRAALAYASAELHICHKILRLAQAGLREADLICKAVTGSTHIMPQGQDDALVKLMNDIKLLGMQITDYAKAAVDEAWRREHDVGYEPHPLGHDDAEFIAQNIASRAKRGQRAAAV